MSNHNNALPDESGLALDAEDIELLREAEENPDALVTDTPNDQKMKTFSVVCIIVNRMIGSGIFSTPSMIVRATNSVPVALLFWIVGSLITFMALCVYLELGLSIPKYRLRGGGDRLVSVPRSGGEKNYLEYMYPKPRFLATCVYAFVFISVGNTAGNALTFAENFLMMAGAGQDPNFEVVRGVAVGVITLACLLHTTWRAGGIAVNNVLAIIKVGILLVVIGSGFAAYAGAFPTVKQQNSFSSGADWAPVKPHGYAQAFLYIVFSYGGCMNANYVLSEVHKPQKTLRKGAFMAVGLVSLLYILTNAAFFAAVPKDHMVRSGQRVAVHFFKTVFGGHVAADRVLPGLVALSSLGNIVVVTFVASRVKAEIAKEGVIPFSRFFAANTPTVFTRLFGRRQSRAPAGDHPLLPQNEEAPAGALMLHWVFSMVIVVSPPPGDAYEFFVNLYSYCIGVCIPFFLAAGLLYLRFKPGSTWVAEASFHPWGGPTITIVYLLFNGFVIAAPWTGATAKGQDLSMKSIGNFVFPTVGTALFVAGALYWVLFRYAWPKLYKRELHQTRIPILLDGVQVHEIVICSWVVPGAPESAEMKDWHLVGS